MSLILSFHNVQSDPGPLREDARYEVQVRINDRIIATGQVEHHNRSDGWEVLVQKYLDEMAENRRQHVQQALENQTTF